MKQEQLHAITISLKKFLVGCLLFVLFWSSEVVEAFDWVALLENLTAAPYDQLTFLPDRVSGQVRFVDNAADVATAAPFDARTIGRLVIPSIGTDSPLFNYSGDMATLMNWGSGIVPLYDQAQEIFNNSIYIHRVLTKTGGALYLDTLKPGDPFYVDIYSIGYRYYYQVQDLSILTEEAYYAVFPYAGSDYQYGALLGQEMLLVTCHPFIYGDSSERILVRGYVAADKAVEIPADDPYYQKYLQIYR